MRRRARKINHSATRWEHWVPFFDLARFDEGVVFIKHTPERRLEWLEKITSILNADELSLMEAESFKGRVQWFGSFLFGRTANLAVHQLT